MTLFSKTEKNTQYYDIHSLTKLNFTTSQLKYFVALVLLLFSLETMGQASDSLRNSCGTLSISDSMMNENYLAYQKFSKNTKSARIQNVNVAVKIHNVLTSGGYGDISSYTNQIFAYLNSRFSGITISFYQSGAINYIYSDTYNNLAYSEESSIMANYNVNNAINVYFVNDAFGSNGKVADFPSLYASQNSNNTNAIFISTGTGKFSTVIIQETIPHEMGHYFNLLHTHTGGESTNYNSNTREWVTRGQGANCSYAGDQICDTPADPYLLISPSGLEVGKFLCTSFFFTQKDPYNYSYKPDVSNLMSYYHGCRTNFTSQQFDRMIWGYNLRNQQNPDLYSRYYIDGQLRFTYQANQFSYCAGSTVNLSFWQFGDFNSSNNFKIQISNNNGASYSDLSTSRSGKYSLQTIIPSNYAQGNYKLKVVSTSPAIEAGSIDISVLATPTATLNGNAEIFQTQNTDLKVQFTGVSPWSFKLSDGTTVNNTSNNPHIVKVSPSTTNSYSITSISNQCGSGTFNGIANVTVKPLTITTGDISPTEICVESVLNIPFQVNFPFPNTSLFTVQISDKDGNNFINIPSQGNTSPLKITIPNNLSSSKNYKVKVISSNPNVLGESSKVFSINSKPIISINKEDKPENFILKSNSQIGNQWLFEGKEIASAIDSLYIPEKIGNYSVRVSKNGCVVNSNNSILIKIDKPSLELMGENPFCEGSSTLIKAPKGFGIYKWTLAKDTLKVDGSELSVKNTGSYRVLVGRGKILSPFSDSLKINTKPNPPKPIVLIENSSLKSSSSINNQWYLGGIAIKDSTGQYLKGFGSGAYTVKVTQNGCFSESDAFLITGTEPNDNILNLKLYPNPNEGTFWVELPQPYKLWQTDIFDVQGKIIYSKVHTNSNKEQINIKPSSGVYIMRVTIDKLNQSIKFVID
jgi:Secretion system C-terminal sorting domain/Pregnancy-associated plasma protein-A